MSGDWQSVCRAGEIDEEDVLEFKHEGRRFAVYRLADDRYYATDGLCTHEKVPLSRGLVIDDVIECPMHQGRFHIPSGAARSAPACVDLRTYPVKVEGGQVYIQIESEA